MRALRGLPIARSGSGQPPRTEGSHSRHLSGDLRPRVARIAAIVRNGQRTERQSSVLTFVRMITTTLKAHVRDPESRKYFGAYLGGKMAGLGIVVFGMWALAWYFSTK